MKLDDFEAVFKSSVKTQFHLERPILESALLITDLPAPDANLLQRALDGFFAAMGGDIEWTTVGEGDFRTVPECMGVIEKARPDMVITYRHLWGQTKPLLYSLGSFVDTMTQATKTPVMLLPPTQRADFADSLSRLERVLVVTDALIGDDRLVNWGVRVCPDDGTLFLAHVEDDATFDYYMNVVSMIPDIDTTLTIDRIKKKLLGRPRDFIDSTIKVLDKAGVKCAVEPLVTMGHALSDYKRIVAENDVHLVVLNTKDERQYAMHGMAHAIAVELQDLPMLLL
jgi:hypothetical protein